MAMTPQEPTRRQRCSPIAFHPVRHSSALPDAMLGNLSYTIVLLSGNEKFKSEPAPEGTFPHSAGSDWLGILLLGNDQRRGEFCPVLVRHPARSEMKKDEKTAKNQGKIHLEAYCHHQKVHE